MVIVTGKGFISLPPSYIVILKRIRGEAKIWLTCSRTKAQNSSTHSSAVALKHLCNKVASRQINPKFPLHSEKVCDSAPIWIFHIITDFSCLPMSLCLYDLVVSGKKQKTSFIHKQDEALQKMLI